MKLVLIILFFVTAGLVKADFESDLKQISGSNFNTIYETGLSFYQRRAENYKETNSVDQGKIRSAISSFETVNQKFPQNLLIKFKLIEAYYFLGHFVDLPDGQKDKYVQRALDVSQLTLNIISVIVNESPEFYFSNPDNQSEKLIKFPNLKEEISETYFWNAITWGIWGMTFGNLSAARNDVAGKIKSRSEVLIKLNPEYRDGAGYRLLGRMHSITPKVPFFTSWIDRDYGLELLRMANEESTSDYRNLLFLAEALKNRNETEESKKLLEIVAKGVPDEKNYLEELETINEAKKQIVE